MPLPLAHPAAVLPLRRWCPKYLNFASLIIGSLTPDMANCLGWDYFAHSFLGSIVFCWPFGLISLWAFYRVRTPLAKILPNPHREALLPLCAEPFGSFFICTMSLLLGIWIHIGWDLFTHDYSWLAQNLGYLSVPIQNHGTYQLRVSHIVWDLSTIGGTILVVAVYLTWLNRVKRSSFLWRITEWRAYLNSLVFLLIPTIVAIPCTFFVSKEHFHLGFVFRAFAEFYIVLLFFTLAVGGGFLRLRTFKTDGEEGSGTKIF